MSCVRCCRGFLSFLILLNMVIGLALIAGAIWLRLDGGEVWKLIYGVNLSPIMAEMTSFHYLFYAIIILGALKTLMGFLGCCCSVSRWVFLPIFLLLGLQVAGGVCTWLYNNEFRLSSEQSLAEYVQYNYDPTFDELQTVGRCCGGSGPSDYKDTSRSSYIVPASCCRDQILGTCTNASRTIEDIGLFDSLLINTEGCNEYILRPLYFYTFRYETLGALAGYVFLEFLILTIIVCACRKRYDDYENSDAMELKRYRCMSMGSRALKAKIFATSPLRTARRLIGLRNP